MKTLIVDIHQSLVNGQRRQMADQIKVYGQYDFWADYADYLEGLYGSPAAQYAYFRDAAVSFNRIESR